MGDGAAVNAVWVTDGCDVSLVAGFVVVVMSTTVSCRPSNRRNPFQASPLVSQRNLTRASNTFINSRTMLVAFILQQLTPIPAPSTHLYLPQRRADQRQSSFGLSSCHFTAHSSHWLPHRLRIQHHRVFQKSGACLRLSAACVGGRSQEEAPDMKA